MNTTPVIIYEDNHLLIVNKPAKWLVQGDQTGDPTLADWGKAYIKEKYEKPGAVYLHPAHRIDRPVSGAVIMARTDKALSRLAEMFRLNQVEKIYYAIVTKAPPEKSGSLKHWLLKDEQKNIVRPFSGPHPGAKECTLLYEVVGPYQENFTLLKIKPLTGRPHQIRVQLSAVGCSIMGDLKYGASTPLPDASIGLHCRSMSFVHPVKKEAMTVVAEFPKWWDLKGFKIP
jgi:23S rRNA pseudouridine1911/1915/1917 synthase